MTKPETASIEVRGLRDALGEGDALAWEAFRHAANAADGLDAHPSLGRCAGCGSSWAEDLGPLALVEAVIVGERAVGLLCGDCTRGEDVPATLERILRAMLPADVRLVAKHMMCGQQAGHA